MRKNPVSQSAFFGSHVFFGLTIVLTVISLALVGFGRSAHETAQSGLRPPSPSSTTPHSLTTPLAFTVTNTNDSGTGSLRQAILDANADSPAINFIDFDIPGPGIHTIVPTSPLPAITGHTNPMAGTTANAVIIDGTSQPGYAGSVLIEAGGGRTLIVTIWQDQALATTGRDVLGPQVQELLGPLMTRESRIVGNGPVLATDLKKQSSACHHHVAGRRSTLRGRFDLF